MADQRSYPTSAIAAAHLRGTVWQLEGELNGHYFKTIWLSHEGAIADRERRLKPRRFRDPKSPTGYRTEYQLGWTAIRRPPEFRNGRDNAKSR